MSGANYYNVPENSVMFPESFSMMQCNISSPGFDGYLDNMLSAQTLPPVQEFQLQPSYCLSSNFTSIDTDNHHQQDSVVQERKQKRIISNRESARRSRMRKQQYFDELWLQVTRLRNENYNLVEKLNNISVSCDKLVQENSKLKEESSDLHQMLSCLPIGSPSPYITLLDSDELPCKTDHHRGASSAQSITDA